MCEEKRKGSANTGFGLVNEIKEHLGEGAIHIKPGRQEADLEAEVAPGQKLPPLAPPNTIPRTLLAERLRQRLAQRGKE